MSSESALVYNVKIFNGQIFTIRGDNDQEFIINALPWANIPEVKALIDLHVSSDVSVAQSVAQVQQVFPTATVEPTPSVIPPQTFAPVPPQQAAPAVAVTAPTCQHGVKVAKKGNGARGEWKGWMCPAQKTDPTQCQPLWVAKNSPEWNTFPA